MFLLNFLTNRIAILSHHIALFESTSFTDALIHSLQIIFWRWQDLLKFCCDPSRLTHISVISCWYNQPRKCVTIIWWPSPGKKKFWHDWFIATKTLLLSEKMYFNCWFHLFLREGRLKFDWSTGIQTLWFERKMKATDV